VIDVVQEEETGQVMGRPTLYRPEYAEQATKLCKLGATDADLADFFGVTTRTIERWRSSKEEFCRAVTIGKEEADNAVERSLYQKAVGYSQEAVKIFMPAGAAEPVYAPYREKIAPDTGAAIFWLKNRRKEAWRDRTEQDVNVKHSLSEDFEGYIRQLHSHRDMKIIDHVEPDSNVSREIPAQYPATQGE
jgi:hypothetical protein